jgi:hypothetical protein
MTSTNTFINASIDSAGVVQGADETGHNTFKIERGEDPPLYGDYFYVFPNDGTEFNIEIGVFGYVDPNNIGNLHPAARQQFSAEESSTACQLIRSYFLSNPLIYTKRWPAPARFLGGVCFRSNWIVEKPLARR